jgi:hypothetical protein
LSKYLQVEGIEILLQWKRPGLGQTRRNHVKEISKRFSSTVITRSQNLTHKRNSVYRGEIPELIFRTSSIDEQPKLEPVSKAE